MTGVTLDPWMVVQCSFLLEHLVRKRKLAASTQKRDVDSVAFP